MVIILTIMTIVFTTITTLFTIMAIIFNTTTNQVFRAPDLLRLPPLNVVGRMPEEKEKRLSISCEFATLGLVSRPTR